MKTLAKIKLSTGVSVTCGVSGSIEPPWRVAIDGPPLGERTFTGEDLFEAMIALRRELEARGSRLLCAGARIDAFPSGMAREMSGARKIYIHRLGYPAKLSDLIDIFDPTEESTVATVEEQARFRRQWVESLRSR